eukprot:PITA_19353
MCLAYACSRKIKVYQINVKSAFLNGELEEEVYIEQPEGFLLSKKEDYVCRLKKALYGIKQDPRAWYAHLDGYLRQHGFKKGIVDSNLYVKIDQDNLTIVEVYVDDVIFGSNDDRLSKNFATKMQSDFEMSLLGDLTYFLGIQISQQEKGIFICQAKYIKEMLKKFKMEDRKPILISMGNNLIIQAFTDEDWVGSVDDRKSTSGAAFYLGGCLVSWLSKNKTSISLSTADAEYIAATSCTQVLWMKQTLKDIQVQFNQPIPIFYDNTSAINIFKNPVMHSKTKRIPIKFHFVREQVAEKNIKLEYVGTKEKIVDIFTKPLPREAFKFLRQKLGILPSSH